MNFNANWMIRPGALLACCNMPKFWLYAVARYASRVPAGYVPTLPGRYGRGPASDTPVRLSGSEPVKKFTLLFWFNWK